MSRVQNKPPVGRRIRKISRTDSECSRGEDERLADDECLSPGDEDGYSLCDFPLPQPPDGGYGWVIVFASFMCNMIVDGIAYTFGVFLNDLASYFGEGKGTTAWVGSLLSGMYLCAGPVVSALTDKYGCRAVCMTGSVIGCLSFVLCIFSPSVYVMMLTYGILGGLGCGLIYLPAVVCVGFYFEQRRSLATGIAVAGSGLGAFAFAPLATILLEQFGWKGANLILAGFILNCAVFGAMMRPLTFSNEECSEKPLLQRMADEKRMQMERGSIGGSFFMVQLPDGTMEKRLKMPINVDPGVHSSFNLDQLSGTPVTPIPTLPTISEVKGPEHGGSSAGSSESGDTKPERRKSRRLDEVREADADPKLDEGGDYNKPIPRNASQPAFTSHVSGLPKNGSVPFFDRIRKTSQGERFRPTLQPIRNSSRGNVTSNGDLRKSLHLKLSTSSFADSAKNNNYDDDGDNESVAYTSSKMSLRMRKDLTRPLSRKDIFYSGSIHNLPEYQSQKSLTGYRMSVVSLQRYGSQATNMMSTRDVEQGPPPELCPCLSLPDGVKTILATMMDFSLLRDPVFLLISISNVFGMAGLYVPFVYLVDDAVGKGIEQNSASFLLSIIGVTNTIGRVVCGFAADFKSVDSVLLNNVCLVISTIAVALTPFCESYSAYIAMSIFFGIAISGYISLTSIILVDLLGGVDKLTNAFGILIMFRGGAAMVGSPIAGAVYDATNSYSTSFFIAAAFFALSAIFSFSARPLKRWLTPPAPPTMQDALTPIDEDEEEEEEDGDDANGGIVIITKTGPSPTMLKEPVQEIEQLESVL